MIKRLALTKEGTLKYYRVGEYKNYCDYELIQRNNESDVDFIKRIENQIVFENFNLKDKVFYNSLMFDDIYGKNKTLLGLNHNGEVELIHGVETDKEYVFLQGICEYSNSFVDNIQKYLDKKFIKIEDLDDKIKRLAFERAQERFGDIDQHPMNHYTIHNAYIATEDSDNFDFIIERTQYIGDPLITQANIYLKKEETGLENDINLKISYFSNYNGDDIILVKF